MKIRTIRPSIVAMVFVSLLAPSAPWAGATARTSSVGSMSLPLSWGRADLTRLEDVAVHEMPPVDVVRLLREDEANRGKEILQRVGYAVKTDLSPTTSGTWESLPEGGRLWRLKFHSGGALWMVLGFDRYRLQRGGALYVYDAGGERVLGPFTSADVREHGEMWLPPIEGDVLVVELYWPGERKEEKPDIHLGTVSHGYKPWGGIGTKGVGDGTEEIEAGACNIDVNCPLGAAWQNEKRAVVNLLSGGSGFCSGSLVTNTAQDCKNYVLTANHCGINSGNAASITFQFNFERPLCGSGIAPTNMVLTGSFWRASSAASDFTLVEMDDPIPQSFNVFYNGWSRSTTPATQSITIHHPNNDEKKISFNDDPLTLDTLCGGSTHWRVDNYEQGTTEPGSSGSPLYDQNHHVVGQLHCGPASCATIDYDAYGRFDLSWNGGGTSSSRLRDWLDPGNTGAVTDEGIDHTFCEAPQPQLQYASHSVGDGQGNGNGIAEPGEAIQLPVSVLNAGNLGATNVGGTLSTSTPLVALTDNQASWPGIGAGQTVASISPHFGLQLDPAFPCGNPIALHLALTASEVPGAWSSDFTVPTGTPSGTVTVFTDNMESGVNGWTTQTLSGTLNNWTQVTTDSVSPTHSWKLSDLGTVSDAALRMPVLNNLAARARLRFKHRINAEDDSTRYDGGVLEFSTNGTTWQDAGSLVTSGGYTGTISSCCSNPLAGRASWGGNSGTWQQVEADLSSLAGLNVSLRWRFASDGSVSDEGWYLDDVVVESTTYVCAPALAPPGEASDPQGPGAPFTIRKDPGGYALAWSAPPAGGTPSSYKLYRSPLVLGGPWNPTCEASLGSGTSAILASLTGGQGFVVVAKNAAGEGSYGEDSNGASRPPASGPNVCP